MSDLEIVRVKKVAGPIDGGAAIFLGNDKKTFVIFVGLFEANAIIKEIQAQKSIRPLTHDLMHNLMVGFGVQVKQVIISEIIDNTFCATLVLEQKVDGKNGEWVGRRNEVRVDARASDSIVVALKAKKDILVSRQVFDQVEDVSDKIQLTEETKEDEEKEGEEENDAAPPFDGLDFGEFRLDDEDE
ncbi:MAG: bifunctional nuclease family protein [Planctomycetes bacterium]|nr:bifunctional nuclease family protein [Planctomycetota bacterium]